VFVIVIVIVIVIVAVLLVAMLLLRPKMRKAGKAARARHDQRGS
jgi:preprotein translocase subunit SecG